MEQNKLQDIDAPVCYALISSSQQLFSELGLCSIVLVSLTWVRFPGAIFTVAV